MKKFENLILSLALLGTFAGVNAFASSAPVFHWTYNARIPSQGATCEEAAQNLAQLVQAANPNAKNVKGLCMARASTKDGAATYSFDTLEVDYDAATPLRLTTTQLPNHDFTAVNLYPNLTDCMNDLPAQKEIFTKETGLAPLTATCIPNSNDFWGYTLTIEGAGEPAKTLHSFRNFTSMRLEDSPEWKKEISDFISKVGGTIVHTKGEMISYYSKPNATISSRSWFTTKTIEQCQEQVSNLKAMLGKMGAHQVLASCHFDGYLFYSADAVYDAYTLSYTDSTYPQVFFSYDECMSVRKSISEKNDNTYRWVGSFCGASIAHSDRFELIYVRAL